MGQDNLLAIRPDAFAGIAISNQKIQTGPDRTRAVSAPDQPWIVDITSILKEDKAYFLVTVLDQVTKKVIGWALDRTLDDAVGKAGLRPALLQQPNGSPGASFPPPHPVLGPLRRLAPTAQD